MSRVRILSPLLANVGPPFLAVTLGCDKALINRTTYAQYLQHPAFFLSLKILLSIPNHRSKQVYGRPPRLNCHFVPVSINMVPYC